MSDTSPSDEIDVLKAFQEAVIETETVKKRAKNPNVIARQILSQDRMIYVAGSFFVYKSGLYHRLQDDELKPIVKRFVRDDYNPSVFTHIKEALISEPGVLQRVENINRFDEKVNMSNGVLDLKTLTLSSHSPNEIFTMQLDAAYDPEAKCPKWEGFLNEMLGDDPAKIQVLQEYYGYVLNYRANIESILFFIGRGANGKSVCIDVMKEVLGPHAYVVISLDDLRKSHYVSMLFGKLVNMSTESNSKDEVCESVLKRLASGEEITVDEKYKAPYTFKSTCKHIYSMNNLPRVADKTDAFFRRVIPIPFNHKVEKEGRVYKLGEKIGREEKNGIFNWSLVGKSRLDANGGVFTRSKQIEDMLDSYRRDNNNVLDFVDECCQVDANYIQDIKTLYEAYTKYCKENGVSAVKKRGLVKELIENYHLTRHRIGAEKQLKGLMLNNGEMF